LPPSSACVSQRLEAIGCAADLGGLQGRFNDASHIDRHLVLQPENIYCGFV
jgi:hypothetical protein